jgi:amino-acid N-acetyltransferase
MNTAKTNPRSGDGNGKTAIRRATEADADAIAALIAERAPDSSLLLLSPAEVRAWIDSFTVAETADGEIVGCVAERGYGDGLVEIRSLAVARSQANKGVGSRLVKRALEQEKANGNTKGIFALTSRTSFFERLGFRIVEKERFPNKIWLDCEKCPKKECCDELAVLFEPETEKK